MKKMWMSLMGAILLIAAQGMAANNCLTFDGVDDWVNTVSGALIPTNGEFTVECWAYAESNTGGYREMLSQGSASNAFYMGTTPEGTIRLGDGWDTGIAYPYGGWHHFAVVKTSSDTLFYIDGGLEDSLGEGIPNPAASQILWLGRQYTGLEYWEGSLDDIRIWSDARTTAEIQNNMAVLSDSDDADLKIWYTCDQDTGSGSIIDSSVNGYGGNLKDMDTATCWETLVSLELDQANETVGWLTNSYALSGTLSDGASSASWTNAATSDSGAITVTSDPFQVSDIPLAYGTNQLTVTAQIDDGRSDSAELTIVREDAPLAVINLLTTNQTVVGETDAIDLVGTNNQWIVGTMTWTNAANAESGSFQVSDFQFQVSSLPLAIGANAITVSGTNVLGTAFSDTVILTRSSESGADNPTHYVSSTGSHTWPFDSLATAANNIQSAIDAAATGDTVLVNAGTYQEGSQITIAKALTLESLYGADWTTIGGKNAHRCLQLSNGACLDGFTITGGYASEGGGIYCADSTVQNCILTGNEATSKGGGIYCRGSTIENSTLSANSAHAISNTSSGRSIYGGGIYGEDSSITNCTFSKNQANTDGGTCGAVSDHDARFYEGGAFGGGIFCIGGRVTACSLYGNSANANHMIMSDPLDVWYSRAYAFGGGIYCSEGTVSLCTISENSANSRAYSLTSSPGTDTYAYGRAYGGGIYSSDAIVRNCTISGNSGIAVAYSYARDSGNTLASTIAHGGGIYCSTGTVQNTVVWGNTADTDSASQDEMIESASGANRYNNGGSFSYTCTTPAIGENCTTDDPQLVGSKLMADSPCIDAGMVIDGITTDIDGTPRPLDGDNDGTALPDIGAYEYLSQTADTDGDGVSDFEEAFLLASGSTTTSNTLDDAIAMITNNPSAYGLYTADSIAELSMGNVMIQTTNGWVQLDLQLEQCTNLVDGIWSNIGPTVLWETAAPEGKAFYRIRGSE